MSKAKSIAVLRYDGKHDEGLMYDISTPEKEAAAYLRLFEYFDEDWRFYSDLEEDAGPLAVCEACQKDLHRLCESGACACEATDECKKRSRQTRRYRDAEQSQRDLYLKAKAGDA